MWINFIMVSEYVRVRFIYVHFDNEEGAADQFHQSDCCVTANTLGIPAQYHSKPRDTGAPASFRATELAMAIARLFARCRAICTHERIPSLEKVSVKIFREIPHIFIYLNLSEISNSSQLFRDLNLKQIISTAIKSKSMNRLKISSIL